jgi:hypothetical protein
MVEPSMHAALATRSPYANAAEAKSTREAMVVPAIESRRLMGTSSGCGNGAKCASEATSLSPW